MLPVLIAGGGISGLTLALSLARHGIASRVFEARPSSPREGAGIQLGPNATRILRLLDLTNALEPHTTSPECIIVNDGITGRELTRLPLGAWIAGRHGFPYWVVHRGALLNVLLTEAKAQSLISVEMHRPVQSIHDQAGAAGVTISFANGDSARGSILVGADGMWSRVREHVNPQFRLGDSGVAAARALVPRDLVEPAFAEMATGVWLAPEAHVVHYPVEGGETIAIIAIGACKEPSDDWSTAVPDDVIADRFQAMPNAVRELLRRATGWRQWALCQTLGSIRWQRDRCVLIGDAAHPILPFLAQGGAMAIEDGFELATTIAGMGGKPKPALEAFGASRSKRVERVQAASIANGRAYHLAGVSAIARNAALKTLPGSVFMRRYDWIYGYRA